MFLPITTVGGGLHGNGFGPWDRYRGRLHPLDLWAREESDHLHAINPLRSVIPRATQLGFGDMHLDDWMSPSELIGAFFTNQDRDWLSKTGGQAMMPSDKKNSFEVKLNVKDYKPEELGVKIANGLVSIEGKHEESTKPDDKNGKGMEEHVYRHFKRTFTVPKNVLEEQLECKLTDDGQLVMSAPVQALEPPPPADRAIPISKETGKLTHKKEKGDTGIHNGVQNGK